MEQTKTPARLVCVWMLLLLTISLGVSCTPQGEEATTGDETTQTENQTGGGAVDPGDTSTPTGPTVPEASGYYINQIKTIAGASTCASYSWASRGKAPAGYIKGMALTYARSYCRYKQNQASPTTLVDILTRAAGSSSIDALALYSSTFSGLGLNVTTAGENPVRSLYTLGIGLGMRESSGKYCEGRDMSASNTSASTAEAGIFQTSYDSMGASAELSKLFAEYKADTSKCFLDTFKEGVSSCPNSSIAGSGVGAEYQAFNKSCPSFAAEYAMVMLRVRRNHYGPINRQEAEVKTQCNQMLKSVQDFIDNDIYACDEII